MKNVLEFLENTRERFPEKTAAVDVNSRCSYDDLNKKAKMIGTFLAERISRRQPVVCFMD